MLLASALALVADAAQVQGYGANPSTHTTSGYTTVQPYVATNPNRTQRDNFSAAGNTNLYTGQPGTHWPRYWRYERRRRVLPNPLPSLSTLANPPGPLILGSLHGDAKLPMLSTEPSSPPRCWFRPRPTPDHPVIFSLATAGAPPANDGKSADPAKRGYHRRLCELPILKAKLQPPAKPCRKRRPQNTTRPVFKLEWSMSFIDLWPFGRGSRSNTAQGAPNAECTFLCCPIRFGAQGLL